MRDTQQQGNTRVPTYLTRAISGDGSRHSSAVVICLQLVRTVLISVRIEPVGNGRLQDRGLLWLSLGDSHLKNFPSLWFPLIKKKEAEFASFSTAIPPSLCCFPFFLLLHEIAREASYRPPHVSTRISRPKNTVFPRSMEQWSLV